MQCFIRVLGFLALTFLGQAEGARVDVACTNTAGDSAILEVANAQSSPGDELVISGSCLVTSTMLLLSERTYRGSNPARSIIRQADGANLLALVASAGWANSDTFTGLPTVLRELTLDGNATNNRESTTDGIIMMSWHSRIEDLRIIDMRGSAIRLTSVNRSGKPITNNQGNGQIARNFIQRSGQHGIFVEDPVNAVTDWNLTDNWIQGSRLNALYLENAAGWQIRGNHLYEVGENAIVAHRMFATTIADNYVEGFGESGVPATYYGILTTVQGDAASVLSGNKVFRFKRQAHRESKFVYLAAIKVNYETGVLAVVGNVLRGEDDEHSIGMLFEKGKGQALKVSVAGNSISSIKIKRVIGVNVSLSAGD